MQSSNQGSYYINLFRTAGQICRNGKREVLHRPYSMDEFDCLVVCLWEDKRRFLGCFVFPAHELTRRGHIGGARQHFAVYLPWAQPTTRKGVNARAWQRDFFVSSSWSENTATRLRD